MTESGVELTKELSRVAPAALRPSIDLCPIAVNDGKVTMPPDEALRGKDVLLLDSAIHSGTMMSHCAAEVLRREPSSLTTYALTVKRCSSFFPTLWGVMTEEGDRPYFLLDKIPNNRLNAGAKHKQPPVNIRLLAEEHVKRPAVLSGLSSIDRVTWSDRVFQMRSAASTFTYLLEHGKDIAGFLTVHWDKDELVVAEVVVAEGFKERGYGGVLLRFAESLARQSDCRTIRLNAISNKVKMYEGFGYQKAGRVPLTLDDEEYHPMDRLVLYHQGRHHIDGSRLTLAEPAPSASGEQPAPN
jgi:ribosomal protein S18 acetylase RimI-like enzyme